MLDAGDRGIRLLGNSVTIRRTVAALSIAPMGAGVVTLLALAWDSAGLPVWRAFLVIAFILSVCWAAAFLVVLPILLVWPQLRQPSAAKAVAFAVLIAWSPGLFRLSQSGRPDHWRLWVFVTMVGAASGALYSIVVRRAPRSWSRAD
jgi:hypothetical protein